MKWNKILLFGICVLLFSSCGTMKKKKFLDHFSTYTYDTLSFSSTENSDIYNDPNTPFSIKGTPIDTNFMHVFSLEEAEDLRYYSPTVIETGPLAYYKIKLNLGYYFVVIRAAGEYWNSRYFGCLYHSGENKVVKTILLAENFGDAGSAFICTSTLKKEEGDWNIYTHHYFQEPVDFQKFEMDSLEIKNVDIKSTLVLEDDRYAFKELSKVVKESRE